jgi:hypothetical protein
MSEAQGEGRKGAKYAQERADGGDDQCRADEREQDGQLSIGQEARESGQALWVWVDELELAAGELLRCDRQVVWVEAVLREARLAECRAQQGRASFEARAVDGGALDALAKVRVGRIGAGHETADHVRVHLVEEELRVQGRVVELERAGTVTCNDECCSVREGNHGGGGLLGHGTVAVERWRVGEVDHHGIFRGYLRRETTKEGGAHIHTRGDELRCAVRQRWERLMRRLQEGGYPLRRQGRGAATRGKLSLIRPVRRTRVLTLAS